MARLVAGPGSPGRVVLGYSATGAGHRSCALAVAESLREVMPDIDVRVVDLVSEYASFPFTVAPQFYRAVARSGALWSGVYAMGAGPRRARVLNWLLSRLLAAGSTRAVTEQRADLYVSFHPALTAPLLRAARQVPGSGPVATVVTDLTSMTDLWFVSDVDSCFVPTDESRRVALRAGMRAQVVRVTGLPVARRFCPPTHEQVLRFREQLRLPTDQPVVLVAGGGDGVGPLASVTEALTHLPWPLTVVLVCGRNERLRHQIQQRRYPASVRVFGEVPDMHALMAASDIFVTKAGPSALGEAFAIGLPIVLCHRIAGQENGNVRFATQAGAAVWAPGGARAASAVADWLRDPGARHTAALRSRALAYDDGARVVTQHLLELMHAYAPSGSDAHPRQ